MATTTTTRLLALLLKDEMREMRNALLRDLPCAVSQLEEEEKKTTADDRAKKRPSARNMTDANCNYLK